MRIGDETTIQSHIKVTVVMTVRKMRITRILDHVSKEIIEELKTPSTSYMHNDQDSCEINSQAEKKVHPKTLRSLSVEPPRSDSLKKIQANTNRGKRTTHLIMGRS